MGACFEHEIGISIPPGPIEAAAERATAGGPAAISIPPGPIEALDMQRISALLEIISIPPGPIEAQLHSQHRRPAALFQFHLVRLKLP